MNLNTIHVLFLMCGIWALLQTDSSSSIDPHIFQDFQQLRPRGPDHTSFQISRGLILGFHRLSIINDTFHSNQPFIKEDSQGTVFFLCNGEIYNYKELADEFGVDSTDKTTGATLNDCAILFEIYWKLRKDGCVADFPAVVKNRVKGEYAFLIFELDHLKNIKKLTGCRDEIGVRPLYFSPHPFEGQLLFTSELKGGLHFGGDLIEFPPGRMKVYDYNELGTFHVEEHDLTTVYTPAMGYLDETDDSIYLQCVQEAVMNSVRRRLSADRPLAFLLSGGVDSSLVAALSAKILKKPIRTFCCGMAEGTDLKYAREVAKHIGSQHTEVFFTPEEGLDVIPDVIRTVESWDTTTIRASVGQYLVCQWIGKNTDCKVVMVGEGPDEVCSSYLFNWYAPSGQALDKCAREYVKKIHYYDVKRADRCIARWGLEGRVALLDPEFIREYWSIPAADRMPATRGMEKWWLRKAFDGMDVLPDSVLWRKKEAFSDGVSSGEKSWFQIIQEWVSDKVTDEEMAGAPEKYPYCTPQTKEAYYYRRVFCDVFGEARQQVIPGYWQPKWSADGKEVLSYMDPSARVLGVYKEK